MKVQVHKFGGASVKDADGVRNVSSILTALPGVKIVVVSATGKTTNALEAVVNNYVEGKDTANELLEKIKSQHVGILQDLGLTSQEVLADIMDTFVEIDWILEDEVQDGYDYIYDQIVSVGELISSKILYYQCMQAGLRVSWVDARGLIITDNTYREAKVEWSTTQQNVQRELTAALTDYELLITQGFIGSSTENFTTTLGREGSDFSAGILAYCGDSESLTIWKDVQGVLTADPRLFDNVTKLDRLDYREAIEMTYYGAKVIHPKTIKPLQNKNIPLYVKPFSDHKASGTMISDAVVPQYPPVIVIEQNQLLIHISTKDFSFVAEQHLSEIFAIMTDLNIKVNMMRNTAISFTACIQDYGNKADQLMEQLSEKYTVHMDRGLELLTIRHFDGSTRENLTSGKAILFEEIISDTIRLAVKDIPVVVRKA